METKKPNWNALKQAIIAIAIGAAINFVTLVLQAVLGWLQDVSPEVPGTILGAGKYLWSYTHTWRS